MISEGGTAEIWNGSNRALFCYFFNFQTKALSLSICLLEIFGPDKKIHLHLCDYLDFEHCTYERRPQATIYLFVHIAQKVYAQ